MKDFLSKLFSQWTWTMAKREWHSQKKNLRLYLLCISIGIAALVSIHSLAFSVRSSIDEQSRSLLGSDLSLKARAPIDAQWLKEIESKLGPSLPERRFAGMINFLNSELSPRLIQVRAISEGYPIYGKIKTTPERGSSYLQGDQCLVEGSLILQYNAKIGDQIKLGQATFTIAAQIESLPGESGMLSELAPRVLIPFSKIESTKLISFGSRIQYLEHFAFPAEGDHQQLVGDIKAQAGLKAVRVETSMSRQERVRRLSTNLFTFLNFSAILSLVLGAIGVGSSIHVYINKQLKSAAILKCMGAQKNQVFAVYVLQILLLGFVGSILGVCLGLVIQFSLPQVINQFFPFEIQTHFNISSILLGLIAGTLITLLSSLPSLKKIADLNPLQGLRPETISNHSKSKFNYFFYPTCIISTLLLTTLSSENIKMGLLSGLALIIIIICLSIAARIFLYIIRKVFPSFLPFTYRQGLKNLFRPNNQTHTLIIALGTGVFVISLLFLLRENLLYQVRKTTEDTNPNFVLFDIQHDQSQELKYILNKAQVPILQEVPIIDLRLRKVNGTKVSELIQKNATLAPEKRIPSWALNRTYRCTYQNKILESEKLLYGDFIGHFDGDFEQERIPVSIESGMLEKLQVKLGDTVDFELSGIDLPCVITSVRDVEWMQMRPNFFFVFPSGPLNEAPQMQVIVSRSSDPESTNRLQTQINSTFPNISFLDLTLVIKTMTALLDKLSLAIRFMAGFSILTGFIILTSTLKLSQNQRQKESVLLKILGASKKQIQKILLSEFTFLAIISTNTGCLIAYILNQLIGRYVFENTPPITLNVLFISNISLTFITICIGLLNSKQTFASPSLESLRE
ncbi:putative permease domain protein [Lentisphaera araneosa HTCC2155]|uniref:Putative permease domain protein n=1 Tax=Lentisphaera araneosa HTCC2155 TaxID=313628 RepID=A6DU86_9BACT|nr:FtsX-like permease family protein [Lentisphaera araneosa]EDM24797.1 putative permease domain protein [Lentisphaera araneosa HTCC2155]